MTETAVPDPASEIDALKAPVTPAVLRHIEKAKRHLAYACEHGFTLRASIPARPDVDDDLVIATALDAANEEIISLRAALQQSRADSNELLRKCRDAIANAVFVEDGLDGAAAEPIIAEINARLGDGTSWSDAYFAEQCTAEYVSDTPRAHIYCVLTSGHAGPHKDYLDREFSDAARTLSPQETE